MNDQALLVDRQHKRYVQDVQTRTNLVFRTLFDAISYLFIDDGFTGANIAGISDLQRRNKRENHSSRMALAAFCVFVVAQVMSIIATGLGWGGGQQS